MDNQFRKSPRAKFLDYDAGIFFITICTKNKIHYFGKIINEKMHLSPIGEIVDYQLANAEKLCNYVDVPLYVVMPNHIHAIVICRDIALRCVNENSTCQRHVPTENYQPISQRNPNPSLRDNPTCQRHVPTLSRYISSLKGAVTKLARNINPEFGWQERYHDHLIRGNRDGNKIAEYIENNVAKWNSDCFYS